MDDTTAILERRATILREVITMRATVEVRMEAVYHRLLATVITTSTIIIAITAVTTEVAVAQDTVIAIKSTI